MSKYSRELKCILAKQCLAGVSSTLLVKQYSISSRQIRYWAQYLTVTAKLKTINLMWTKGVTHTSAVLNLSSSGILSVWLQKYRGIKELEPQRLGWSSIHESLISTSIQGRFLTNFTLYVISPKPHGRQ